MSDCLFCKIIAGAIPAHKVYEDDRVLAFLDIGPVSTGHTLVIPKTHAENFNAGSREDAAHLAEVVHVIAPAIMRAVDASGYNLGMNHGVAAGQDVLHTHLHLMPRQDGSQRTFTKTHPSQDELAAVAEKIRKEIR